MADVLVVGAGVIGLTAAVRLLEAGARVRVWTAHEAADTVSAVAAAVWYPTRAEPDPRVLDWATATYAEFRRQIDAGVPGTLLRRTRMVVRDDGGPLWWAPAAGNVVRRGENVFFDAPLAEMDTYLSWLAGRVRELGGRIERHRIADLAEAQAEAPVVVNATGLAAGELCGDPDVRPARGHVVLVANPGLDESVRDEGHPDGVTYVHPRTRDVVLGGTYQLGRSDTNPDPDEAAAIVRRCVALVPQLAGAPVLGSRVGLRPARRGGPRVSAVPAGDGRLVHAYGHGGAGMTLAWGCADTVTHLALGTGPTGPAGPPRTGAP
ncbi:FAD-dependent oxidoreductase [Paractinoplanes rishiriensis]|uniref:D-amino-acid oxidase n=1 Tax=Paractinoplanes rishiriensis TaxID=1050105 RepID=A0A919MNV4_9ACTN|nr:FAD-dependent oxidoreductase [Actinoplanes rishiriensis]GIE94431.1 D-amino-acid oxidase [Actinoplanes rishiriensis]